MWYFLQNYLCQLYLYYFAIVVIINKAFKLFNLVLVVYCDSCCHWWYPGNSAGQKNVYNTPINTQRHLYESTWRFYFYLTPLLFVKRSLCSHALLILAKSSVPKSQLMWSQSSKQWELAQLDRRGTGNTTVIGLRVQALLEVSFLFNLLCSNTSLPEWSTLGKTRLSWEQSSPGVDFLDSGKRCQKSWSTSLICLTFWHMTFYTNWSFRLLPFGLSLTIWHMAFYFNHPIPAQSYF